MQVKLTELNQAEILRYLGYHGQEYSVAMDALLHTCMEQMLRISVPKYLYRKFTLTDTPEGIRLDGTGVLLTGNDIRAHLGNAQEVYLLCATIGLAADREIRTKMISAPDEGVILDSCATAAIEQVADLAEQEVAALCRKAGKNTTWRFSAGYGDLPLQIQGDIITAMDTYRKIGLAVTESMLMTPSKSVTAIIGVTEAEKDARKNKCDYCGAREHCTYRKRGTTC